jgi:glycosyltransferase involved in cell wall biosynthesis
LTSVAVLSSARWASFKLSKHFVAEAMAAAGNDVLYVDPPFSAGSLIRDRNRRADRAAPAEERPQPRLQVWRPRVLPGQNAAVGQLVNAAVLRRGVLHRLAPDRVVAFALEARTVFEQLPGRRIYYCTDSNEDVPGVDGAALRRWEQRLVAAADAVVACSLPLAVQLTERGATVEYIPHGVDAEAFLTASPADELARLPRPLVGYVGSFNFRLDAALLDAARRAALGGTLVLVGGGFGPAAGAEVAALAARDDVVALGHRPPHALPSLMAALDVAVVPYRSIAFNRKSFPIKVLQHLATGVPVVSTPNGATDELGDAVTCVETADEMHDGVRAAVERGARPEDVARRHAIARSRPWSAVAQRLLRL